MAFKELQSLAADDVMVETARGARRSLTSFYHFDISADILF